MATAPRFIEPGSYYLSTRNCADQRFWLRPDKPVTQHIAYALALTLRRYPGVHASAIFVLSSHLHLITWDRHGESPNFHRDFLSLVARGVNAHRRRRGPLFDAGKKLSLIPLPTQTDLKHKLVYVLNQAVAAGIVTQPHEWQGLRTTLHDLQHRKTYVAKRPGGFFQDIETNPAKLTIDWQFGPDLEDDPAQRTHFLNEVAALLDTEVNAVTQARAQRNVIGMKAVMATQPSATARRKHPMIVTLNPHIIARDKALRLYLIARLQAFRRAYLAARRAWSEGTPTLFPRGTFRFTRLPRRIANAPPAAA